MNLIKTLLSPYHLLSYFSLMMIMYVLTRGHWTY